MRQLGANFAAAAEEANNQGLTGALLLDMREEALDELGLSTKKIMKQRVLRELDALCALATKEAGLAVAAAAATAAAAPVDGADKPSAPAATASAAATPQQQQQGPVVALSTAEGGEHNNGKSCLCAVL